MSEQAKSWLETRLPVCSALNTQICGKPMPASPRAFASLGAVIMAASLFLCLSGLVLALYYVPAAGRAFQSIQFIQRDVNDGWLVRGFHATGTTMLFGAAYLAIFNSMLSRAYRAPGELVWALKLVALLVLLLVGYLGYTMADGAVSYWSLHNATLGSTQLNGIPGAVGSWFFGGPAGPSTLARLGVLHAVLALAFIGVLIAHGMAKRAVAAAPARTVPLHPYYTAKAGYALALFALVFAVLLFFAPHLGENPLNAIPANPLVVPAMLTPPWYLLVPSALSGALHGTNGAIAAFIAAFAVLFALPWLDRAAPGTTPGFAYKALVVVLALDVFSLGCTYADGPSTLNSILTVIFTGWYFLHFLVLTPLVTAMETK